MNAALERNGVRKLFQPVSLCSRIVPTYLCFDTKALMMHFGDAMFQCKRMDQTASKQYSHVKENQSKFWNALFNMKHRVFRGTADYAFRYMLRTDGVGVSLVLKNRKKYSRAEKRKQAHPPDPPCITQLDRAYCEQLRNRKIVGLDPGKFNLVYMTDGKHQLRYTAFQRRRESTF